MFLLLLWYPVKAAPKEKEPLIHAVSVLREKMVQRKKKISLCIHLQKKPAEEVPEHLYQLALAPTIKGEEGDYLYWSIKDVSIKKELKESKKEYLLYLTYSLSYYTTKKEEEKISEILSDWEGKIEGKDTKEKIQSINSLIGKKLSYDSGGEFSGTYQALTKKKTTCLGYAMIFYRMTYDLNLPCRIATGYVDGKYHCWLVFNIDKEHYHIDPLFYQQSKNKNYLLQPWEIFSDGRSIDVIFWI